MLIRMGDNKLVVISPSDNALEIIKKVFKKQRYKVGFYNNDSTQLRAIRVISRGKKRKGRLHFSILTKKDNSIHIEGHKDRYIRGHFETNHKSSQAKRETNRLQGILAKALEIKSSELIVMKKEDLREYGERIWPESSLR